MDVKELLENKEFYLDRKKQAIKFTDQHTGVATKSTTVDKATNFEDTDSVIKRTIIGNTYNWMDSHDDVHIKGCFAKSISEKSGRIWHLHDHERKVVAKVGVPFNIQEKDFSWAELGQSYSGVTTALMMDTEIKRELNPVIFDAYKNNEIDQHSVGMQYVKLLVAANDADYKEEFSNWQTYYPMIANKERADEKGYFFVVQEAKLYEISCVLDGSNSVTPTLQNIEPSTKDTHKTEPSTDTQTEMKQFFNPF